jgi:hypothetical protein
MPCSSYAGVRPCTEREIRRIGALDPQRAENRLQLGLAPEKAFDLSMKFLPGWNSCSDQRTVGRAVPSGRIRRWKAIFFGPFML